MKKFLATAIMASLFVAGSAFAGNHKAVSPNATFAFGVGGAASGPTTTNNDDSCDISVAPAATLLLPYFNVDYTAPQTTAETTLFTVTNVSRVPQIAHVTVWSDWSYPVLDFNLFLTGYDVQAINLYDVIARGVIAPTSGTSNATTPGQFSLANSANPNFGGTAAASCGSLPGAIPLPNLTDLRTALTTGTISACGTTRIGGTHTSAVGYVTIDVSSTCSTTLPTTSGYYTGEILFDNVLIGDYQQINPNPTTGNYAGGNPLVHIRAVPEGGPAGSLPGTNLPYTFYDRYTPAGARTADRRQPLPSTFAARFIQGGTNAFNTNYKIWREGITGAAAACNTYVQNSSLAVADIVRFDEHENPTTAIGGVIISPAPSNVISLPETSSTSTSASTFPTLSTSGDVGGWMFLDLNNGGASIYSASRPGFAPAGSTTSIGPRASQNWVIVSMFAEGRYSTDFDAAWLGNGCSPADVTANPVGPAGGTPVCPAPLTCGYTTTGTNVTP
jgi:hypothetical protein